VARYKAIQVAPGQRVVDVPDTKFDGIYYFGARKPPASLREVDRVVAMHRGHDWKPLGARQIRVSYSDPGSYWILLRWGVDKCLSCGETLPIGARFCPACGGSERVGSSMGSTRPQTVADWGAYIKTLAGEPLYSQAVAANSQTFARELIAEGTLKMGDVEQIMKSFVRQLRATGTKVPGGGAWDLLTMAQTDPVARKGPTMGVQDADALESAYEPSGTDDFDTFELEAVFE